MSGEKTREHWLNLRLPQATYQRLDELGQTIGKDSTEIAREAIETYLRFCNDAPALERLTPRQREVLQLIAEGHKTKEIARKLNISIKTVEMHRAQLMETLDLRNIVEVVRFAVRAGVVSP